MHPSSSTVRATPIGAVLEGPSAAAVARAIQWVKDNQVPGGGIAVHHRTKDVTQEVTGYLIPTMMDVGEEELAVTLARWEASVQRPDGSLAAPDSVPYTFDTAQVARGFLAVLDRVPELEANLRRACDYVASQIGSDGKVHHASLDAWKLPDGTILTDYCNLFVLPPLVDAGERLGEPRYIEAARRAVEYFRRKSDLVTFKREAATFTHMFGYMMEALVDLGELELAEKGLAQAEAIQQPDGSIPAYPGATWVCSTGMAQLAIAWLKLGRREPATRAVRYLERLQHPGGGFFGSYGKGAVYFTKEEISWAVKFFIDAELLAARPE
jgi:malonyl-CoA O-methyltransferase